MQARRALQWGRTRGAARAEAAEARAFSPGRRRAGRRLASMKGDGQEAAIERPIGWGRRPPSPCEEAKSE